MLKTNRRARWVTLAVATTLLPAVFLSPATAKPSRQAQRLAFSPAVTLMAEVITPAGQPRQYTTADGKQTIWQPGQPVYIGDRIVLNTFVSTGDSTLKEVRVRLDNQPVTTLTKAPWRVDLDTTNWRPGYHMVEVFGQSNDPRVQSGSATMAFYATSPSADVTATKTTTTITGGATRDSVTEPVTMVAGVRETPEPETTAPAHPGQPVPLSAAGVPLYQDALNVTIHSRDAAAERAIRAGQDVQITQPTLFYVTANGPRVRQFIYSLTRGGQEVYRSDALPINALVRLQPKTANEAGLLPGPLSMWVWTTIDGNTYGAPTRVILNIVPQS